MQAPCIYYLQQLWMIQKTAEMSLALNNLSLLCCVFACLKKCWILPVVFTPDDI